MSNLLLDSALFYAKQNLPIFPVGWDKDHKKRKHPLVEWKRFQTILPTEEEIRNWWRQFPNAGIGMATGQLSGIIAVDAEAQADLNFFNLQDSETPTTKTGGGGRHFLFAYENLRNATRFAPYYDFRGEGGYILLPPSPHESGQKYEWLKPLGSVSLAVLPDSIRKCLKANSTVKENGTIVQLLNNNVPEGSRNSSATRVAGSLLYRFPLYEWENRAWPLLLSWNEKRAVPPLDEKELRIVFESIAKNELARRSKNKAVKMPRRLAEEEILLKLEEKTDERFVFSVLFEEEEVWMTFADLEWIDSKEIFCSIKIHVKTSKDDSSPIFASINLISVRDRELLARQSEKNFGTKTPWFLILGQACAAIQRMILSADGSLWIGDAPQIQKHYLFEPFLANSDTVFFGEGGSAKTTLALRLATSLASGKEFLGWLPNRKIKTLFVDYESSAEQISNILRKIAKGTADQIDFSEIAESVRYFSPRGLPFPDIVSQLSKIAKNNDLDFLIVDSALFACGGAPEDAKTVGRYFNALSKLGLPSLTIAHENRLQDHYSPFGSIFWRNCPRSLWNVRQENDERKGILHQGLIQRKSNFDSLHPIAPLRLTFNEDSIIFEQDSDNYWKSELTLTARLLQLLAGRALTLSEICEELPDEKKKIISVRLSELKQKKYLENSEGLWHQVNNA